MNKTQPPPGYAQATYPTENYTQAHNAPPPPPGGAYVQTAQGPVYTTQTMHTTTVGTSTFNSLRTAIPELPMGLAITLCVINFILPGIGTVIAGFSVLCCGNPGSSDSSKFGTFCINFWIGLAQLILVVFTVGWIWSIMWGVAFIAISEEARQRKNPTTITTVTQVGNVTTGPAQQYGMGTQYTTQYTATGTGMGTGQGTGMGNAGGQY